MAVVEVGGIRRAEASLEMSSYTTNYHSGKLDEQLIITKVTLIPKTLSWGAAEICSEDSTVIFNVSSKTHYERGKQTWTYDKLHHISACYHNLLGIFLWAPNKRNEHSIKLKTKLFQK